MSSLSPVSTTWVPWSTACGFSTVPCPGPAGLNPPTPVVGASDGCVACGLGSPVAAGVGRGGSAEPGGTTADPGAAPAVALGPGDTVAPGAALPLGARVGVGAAGGSPGTTTRWWPAMSLGPLIGTEFGAGLVTETSRSGAAPALVMVICSGASPPRG